VALSGDELADAFSLFLSVSRTRPLSEDRAVIIRSAGSERRRASGAGREERAARAKASGKRRDWETNAAAQTPRHKIHNLIQLSKLLPTSRATEQRARGRPEEGGPAPAAVPSCVLHSRQLRSKGAGRRRGARARFISRCPPSPLLSLFSSVPSINFKGLVALRGDRARADLLDPNGAHRNA